MEKAPGKLGDYMITDIVNQTKGVDFRHRKLMGLEITDQILKIAERIIEKLIRQQADIDEMHFGFMSGCGTTNVILILRE